MPLIIYEFYSSGSLIHEEYTSKRKEIMSRYLNAIGIEHVIYERRLKTEN